MGEDMHNVLLECGGVTVDGMCRMMSRHFLVEVIDAFVGHMNRPPPGKRGEDGTLHEGGEAG